MENKEEEKANIRNDTTYFATHRLRKESIQFWIPITFL